MEEFKIGVYILRFFDSFKGRNKIRPSFGSIDRNKVSPYLWEGKYYWFVIHSMDTNNFRLITTSLSLYLIDLWTEYTMSSKLTYEQFRWKLKSSIQIYYSR